MLRVLATASDARGDAATNAGRAAARRELRLLLSQTEVENWNTMAAFVKKRAAVVRAGVNADGTAGNFSLLESGTHTNDQAPPSSQSTLVASPFATLAIDPGCQTLTANVDINSTPANTDDITALNPAQTIPVRITLMGDPLPSSWLFRHRGGDAWTERPSA